MSNSNHQETGVIESFKVRSDRKGILVKALELVFRGYGTSKFEGWSVDDKGNLKLWSYIGWESDSDKATKFMTPVIDAEILATMIFDWLKTAEPKEREPDTDGSVYKGYELDLSYRYLKITPVYITYGK